MDTVPVTSVEPARRTPRRSIVLVSLLLIIALAGWLFFLLNPESWSALTARADAKSFSYLEQQEERQFGGSELMVGGWAYERIDASGRIHEQVERAGMTAAIVQSVGESETQVVVMSPDERTVVSDSSLKMGLSISADGTRLAFVRIPQITLEDGSVGHALTGGAWQVVVVDSASGEEEWVMPGTWAAFMGPEHADHLLYALEGSLMLMNLATQESVDTGLATTERRDAFMLSDSGKRLALKSELTEGYVVYDLYRVEPSFSVSPLLDIGFGYVDLLVEDDHFYGIRARPGRGTQVVRGALSEGEPLSVRMTFPEDVRIIGFGSRN